MTKQEWINKREYYQAYDNIEKLYNKVKAEVENAKNLEIEFKASDFDIDSLINNCDTWQQLMVKLETICSKLAEMIKKDYDFLIAYGSFLYRAPLLIDVLDKKINCNEVLIRIEWRLL